MNLQFLKYFVVLSEELHFGRAADRLAITQPPLSAAIKSLESELGVQLLLRNSKKVELTPEGAAFRVEARQILERVERARSVVKAVNRGLVGRLDVGLSPSLIYRRVIEVIAAFRTAHPGIEVVLHEMTLSEQAERLLRGQLHVGFTNTPTTPPKLASLRLPDDVFALCLPESHPMARKSVIDLRDMAQEEFILFTRDIGPVNFDNVIAIFARCGIHPRTVHQVRGWLSTIALVAHGVGVALVPSSLARARMGGVCFVPIAGPKTTAPAMMLWNPALPAPGVDSFIESASRTIRQQKSHPVKHQGGASRSREPALRREGRRA